MLPTRLYSCPGRRRGSPSIVGRLEISHCPLVAEPGAKTQSLLSDPFGPPALSPNPYSENWAGLIHSGGPWTEQAAVVWQELIATTHMLLLPAPMSASLKKSSLWNFWRMYHCNAFDIERIPSVCSKAFPFSGEHGSPMVVVRWRR
jgi:hypothetical protein